MQCPNCTSFLSKVIDKRAVKRSGQIRRRRECLKCQDRFTTYEQIFFEELLVIKKDGRREAFSKEKLRTGIGRALEKRPGFEQVDLLTDKVEKKIRQKKVREVQSRVVGMLVLAELKKLDQVAYMRFASVYRSFDQAEDFTRELNILIK